MRLLVATDQWFPDLAGGAARVATETARRLAERGHEVTVLAPVHDDEPEAVRDGSLTLRRVLPRHVVPQTFSDPVNAFRQGRHVPVGDFDGLIAHQPTVAAGLAMRRDCPPMILVYYASAPREMRFLRSRSDGLPGRLSATILLPPIDALDRVAVKRASTILILSEFTRSLLREDHGEIADAAVRVPGAVDVDFFTPGHGPAEARRHLDIDESVPLLFTARRLEPRMGIEELLRAVALLGRERRVMLAVAGSGELETSLKQLARDVDLADRVRFTGRVSEEELREWYRAADAFVLPTAAYEGFGLVTAEALSCGTPVVGTPIGATPELLEPLDPDLVAPGATPDDLAIAIEAVTSRSTPDFRRRCRAYAVENFAWSTAMDEWELAIRSALSDPRLSSGGNNQVSGIR